MALYADDIALIAPDKNSLQGMLDIVSDWCFTWKLSINSSKTKVVHFRPQSCSKTDCVSVYWLCGRLLRVDGWIFNFQ